MPLRWGTETTWADPAVAARRFVENMLLVEYLKQQREAEGRKRGIEWLELAGTLGPEVLASPRAVGELERGLGLPLGRAGFEPRPAPGVGMAISPALAPEPTPLTEAPRFLPGRMWERLTKRAEVAAGAPTEAELLKLEELRRLREAQLHGTEEWREETLKWRRDQAKATTARTLITQGEYTPADAMRIAEELTSPEGEISELALGRMLEQSPKVQRLEEERKAREAHLKEQMKLAQERDKALEEHRKELRKLAQERFTEAKRRGASAEYQQALANAFRAYGAYLGQLRARDQQFKSEVQAWYLNPALPMPTYEPEEPMSFDDFLAFYPLPALTPPPARAPTQVPAPERAPSRKRIRFERTPDGTLREVPVAP